MNLATAASSGIACDASNSFSSALVTNSGPRASLALKKFSLRWCSAPRSAKHIPYGARLSASSASRTAHTSGLTGLFSATDAVIMRCFGLSTREGRTVLRNSPSACSRVMVGTPSASACPFGRNTVFLVALLRHSSMASASRTISMCERYCSSDMSGYLVRIISRTTELNSWMFGGPRRTPERPHLAMQLKLPFGGSTSTTLES